MKINNEVKHIVNVTNELGEKMEIALDISDMVQVAIITDMFAIYDELMAIEWPESNDIQELRKVTRQIADKTEEVNHCLDAAFGRDLREKAFRGSSSMVLYNDFFNQLAKEIESAGIKVSNKAAELKKKYLLNDHKKSDTI